jgi:hypothetical protein
MFFEMAFPINALELKNPAILIRPNQVKSTTGKDVIIGDLWEDAILRGPQAMKSCS